MIMVSTVEYHPRVFWIRGRQGTNRFYRNTRAGDWPSGRGVHAEFWRGLPFVHLSLAS